MDAGRRCGGRHSRNFADLRYGDGTISRFARHSSVNMEENSMLRWAIIFLVISLITGFLGFSGVSAATATISKVLFVVALVIFLIFLVLALMAGSAVT
jgi:uncharacterized membrane protein YtjA (UPF0391 family)